MKRTGLITFCGSKIDIEFDPSYPDALQCLKNYENGLYKNKPIKTCNPNLLKCVLTGKKGWGLWVKLWSEGIREGSFTKFEILEEFDKRNIKIPPQFLKEFENRLEK